MLLGLALLLGLARVTQRQLVQVLAQLVRSFAASSSVPEESAEATPPLQPVHPAVPVSEADFLPVDEPARAAPVAKRRAPLPTTLIGPAQVESWVQRGVIPEVAFAPALGVLPSGLVCASAPSFVAGLREDDRLVRVGGQRVASLEDVVVQVAAARRTGRQSIQGTFCRASSGKLKCLNLAVTLPPLELP